MEYENMTNQLYMTRGQFLFAQNVTKVTTECGICTHTLTVVIIANKAC